LAAVAWRTLGVTWVRDRMVGDVMVDWSVRAERLRPLGVFGTLVLGRRSRTVLEQAGRGGAIGERERASAIGRICIA
jgi:hypothetical protein